MHPTDGLTRSQHVYEIRPRKDHRGVDLISDVVPFGSLWYAEPNAISNAVGYAKFYSRSHHAVICVYDEGGNLIGGRRKSHVKIMFLPPGIATCYPRSVNRNIFYIIGVIVVIVIVLKVLGLF